MSRIPFAVALLTLCVAAAQAQPNSLEPLLKNVEKRYNKAKTIQVLFEQSYTAQGRPSRTERGELFLRKPGKMRWQYTSPAGKLFLSDGKFVYFYSPSTNRVEKSRLKESEDFRAPLAFLLGKLDFSRDFTNYQSRQSDGDTVITAVPKNNRLPYRQVEFTVGPGAGIKRLLVTGQDQALIEFRFAEEKVNPTLAQNLFSFNMPPGAQFVDTSETEQRTN